MTDPMLSAKNSRKTIDEIYRAVDEINFEKKYGFPVKLAEAAPEMLKYIQEMVRRYPNNPWIYEEGKTLIKKATQ